MIDIFLEMHWSNNPIPLDQLKSDPDFILDIPLGLFTSLESPVKSVNGLVGNVVLNAEDVGADPVGVAQAVLEMLDNQKLDKIDYVQHFRGLFSSYATLVTALPTALDGDYAHIDSGSGFDRMSAIWDSDDSKWTVNAVNVGSNTDEVPEGSTNLYFTSERVRQATLMGLDLSDSNAVVTTDAILVAIGKLQAQLNQSTGRIDWVLASSICSFASTLQDSISDPLMFAKINDVLWVKGSFAITASTSGTLLTIIDVNWKMFAPNSYYNFIKNILFNDGQRELGGYNSVQIKCSVLNRATNANNAQSSLQRFESSSSLAPATYRFAPQPLGELLFK